MWVQRAPDRRAVRDAARPTIRVQLRATQYAITPRATSPFSIASIALLMSTSLELPRDQLIELQPPRHVRGR